MTITSPVVTEQTCLVGALQQLQVAMTLLEPQCTTPTLSDVAGLIEAVQRDFGTETDLEAVIQTLVARDIQRQLCERTQRQHA